MLRIAAPNSYPLYIPGATPTSDGAMSMTDKAKLDALAAPGPWVGLPYQGTFQDIGQAGVVGQSRLVGDVVQLRGAVKNTINKLGGSPIAILAAQFQPSIPRFVPCALADIGGFTTASFWILIDNVAGVLSGTPGAVLLGANYTTPLDILLDGLSFSL
jgi:hypothetical protein